MGKINGTDGSEGIGNTNRSLTTSQTNPTAADKTDQVASENLPAQSQSSPPGKAEPPPLAHALPTSEELSRKPNKPSDERVLGEQIRKSKKVESEPPDGEDVEEIEELIEEEQPPELPEQPPPRVGRPVGAPGPQIVLPEEELPPLEEDQDQGFSFGSGSPGQVSPRQEERRSRGRSTSPSNQRSPARPTSPPVPSRRVPPPPSGTVKESLKPSASAAGKAAGQGAAATEEASVKGVTQQSKPGEMAQGSRALPIELIAFLLQQVKWALQLLTSDSGAKALLKDTTMQNLVAQKIALLQQDIRQLGTLVANRGNSHTGSQKSLIETLTQRLANLEKNLSELIQGKGEHPSQSLRELLGEIRQLQAEIQRLLTDLGVRNGSLLLTQQGQEAAAQQMAKAAAQSQAATAEAARVASGTPRPASNSTTLTTADGSKVTLITSRSGTLVSNTKPSDFPELLRVLQKEGTSKLIWPVRVQVPITLPIAPERQSISAPTEVQASKGEAGEHSLELDEGLMQGGPLLMVMIPKGPLLMEENSPPLMLEEFLAGIAPVTAEDFAYFLTMQLQRKFFRLVRGNLVTGEGELVAKTNDSIITSSIQIEIENGEPRFRPVRGKELHPAVHVSHLGAKLYAKFLGPHFSLPSAAQWMRAACMARAPETQCYRYGCSSNEITPQIANYGGRIGTTTPVGWYNGSHPLPGGGGLTQKGESPFGLQDAAGNVWQWMEERPIAKGGSYASPETDLEGRAERQLIAGETYPDVGLRVVYNAAT